MNWYCVTTLGQPAVIMSTGFMKIENYYIVAFKPLNSMLASGELLISPDGRLWFLLLFDSK